MRYFEVRKEAFTGVVVAGTVDSDGDYVDLPYDTDETGEITVGFSVFEFGENGMTENVEFYAVKTDTTDWSNNEEEVLEQIKADYPAGEWQNHDW